MVSLGKKLESRIPYLPIKEPIKYLLYSLIKYTDFARINLIKSEIENNLKSFYTTPIFTEVCSVV